MELYTLFISALPNKLNLIASSMDFTAFLAKDIELKKIDLIL